MGANERDYIGSVDQPKRAQTKAKRRPNGYDRVAAISTNGQTNKNERAQTGANEHEKQGPARTNEGRIRASTNAGAYKQAQAEARMHDGRCGHT